MNLKSFAIYMGVMEECFEGLDLSSLPDYDELLPDCVNLLALYRWTFAQIQRQLQTDASKVTQLNQLLFECAYYATGTYEAAQDEEVDVNTLEYFETHIDEAEQLGKAFHIVAEAYRNGTHLAMDENKAIDCYRQAIALGCEIPTRIKRLLSL